MGTVRREGDWRLEKRREGVYEITIRREPQAKILTSEAPSAAGDQPLFETLPVREVSSFSDTEGLFEEKAHGPPPVGMEHSSSQTSSGRAKSPPGKEVELADLPPGAIGIAFLIAGSFVLYTLWDTNNEYGLLFGVGFVAGGVLILSYGDYLFRTQAGKRRGTSSWKSMATAGALVLRPAIRRPKKRHQLQNLSGTNCSSSGLIAGVSIAKSGLINRTSIT